MPSVPEPREIPPVQPTITGKRLDSWKEIAAYFQRNERTLRRWEQTEGLPVRRHLHDKRGSVYAHTAELDAWWSSREARLQKQAPQVATWKEHRLVWSAALVGVLAIAGVLTWRFVSAGSRTQSLIEIKPLTSYPGFEKFPSFSPDGTQVAFSWDGERRDNPDIYIKTPGREAMRRITTDPAEELSPAWSPDGRWIAFLRLLSSERADVVVIPVAGGPERTVAEVHPPPKLAVFGSHIAWSPDGDGLVRIAVAHGEKRRLTKPQGQHGDIAAAVSPNGNAVAFIRRTSFAVSELYLLAVSESGAANGPERQITSFGRRTTSPTWTPDGRELLFVSGKPETELWRVAGSGAGRPEAVTSLGEDAALLAPSRQRHLAFTRYVNDSNIWRIRARYPERNGSQWEKDLLISSTRNENYCLYSPDGKQISYESNRSGSRELWRCERDGSHPVQLTSVAGMGVCCSRWSPDGRRLIFVSYPEGFAQLHLIDASGGALQQLTNGPYNYSTPSWSRNGQWIYFQSNRNGESQVWKMPANGGEAVQVTRNGGRLALESVDRKYLYYTKGGTLASDYASLWRTSGPGGQEVQILDGLAGWNSFEVVDEGIYFLRNSGGSEGSIEFFDFVSGKSQRLMTINRPFGGGISVVPGPHGRISEILYTQVDNQGSDLMILEKFP